MSQFQSSLFISWSSKPSKVLKYNSDTANRVLRVSNIILIRYTQATISMLRCLGHTAAHGLLSRRDHYQDWLGIETRMRQPSPQLTTFLAQGTGMAEHMSCKVTSCLTMFALQLVLHKASTAPTWSSKCLTAALLTSLKQRWHKHKLPFWHICPLFPWATPVKWLEDAGNL